MNARTYALLFLLNLGVVALVISFQGAPGYMDAEYNYAGGLQLVAGRGFSEPFLWNYLDDPVGLPHASHAYWMPLGSILAAAGMWLSGATSFASARVGFILLAAGIAPVTAGLAFELSRRRNLALNAGILAAFPGYYLAYLGASDVFGVVMLLGAAYLLIAGGLQPRGQGEQAGRHAGWRLFSLGLISGLMHLSRPDGGVWFLLSLGLMCTGFTKQGSWRQNLGDLLRRSVLVVLGYLLVMGPWLGRNIIAFGAPFSVSSLRSLWLTSYDELYAFPATMLTYERWAGTGLGAILRARAGAFGQNLLTAFAVQGLIFLFPLTIAGAWALRRDWRVRLGVATWVATLLLMSVVFPYSGARGGFFHSGAATQSLWWALAVVGLEGFVHWGARRRGWQAEQARRAFCAGAVLLAMVLTARLAWTRVIGAELAHPAWNQGQADYQALEAELVALGAEPDSLVAVNNPPGYYVAAGRASIAIPYGDVHTLLAACRRYGAEYVLLEPNHPQGLDGLYAQPADWPGLRLLKEAGAAQIFKVEP